MKFKTIIGSTGSKELAHNQLEALGDDIPEVKYDCKYFQSCKVKDFGRINCLTPSTIHSCSSYKFRERYKEFNGGDYLGI